MCWEEGSVPEQGRQIMESEGGDNEGRHVIVTVESARRN